MAIFQFEDNATLSGCNTDTDGSRTYVKNAVTAQSYVENTITVAQSGWYDLSINYTQGLSGLDQSFSPWKALVNGTTEYLLFLYATGAWNAWQTREVGKIYLDNAGSNTIRWIQFGAAADLDYFELNYSAVQVVEVPERLIYHTTTGLLATSPARQNKALSDGDFTSDNFDLTISSASNRCLICNNNTNSTLTLVDANWETLEPYAEIEIYRRGSGTIAIVPASGMFIENTANLNLDANGYAILKHIEGKIWMLKGDLSV